MKTVLLGLLNSRGIDVLLNDESNRETPAVVSFGEKQRFLSLAGAASATMNPESTFSLVKRLIGAKFKDQRILGCCLLKLVRARMYLDAAAIAGLKPLRLVHVCTATAPGYDIYKTDFANAGPNNVVFVDIAHCDAQVSVAAFEPGHIKMLCHSFNRNLGGRNFDDVLFRHFAAQFKEQYRIDVYLNTRASIRLGTACEKLKKVLSAKPEAPLHIECLMDEKDVKREEFEKLSSDILERISFPCHKALADSGLSVDKIRSVELVGSGSRIPAIMKILGSLFRREPGRTLNATFEYTPELCHRIREREGISSNLQETEDWLYEDGDYESEVVYTEQLEDVKKLVDPIEYRYKDGEARAQATRSLLNCIVQYRMAVRIFGSNEVQQIDERLKW